MTTTHGAADPIGTAWRSPHVSGLFRRCWSAFQQRRKHARLRATLYGLSDHDRKDIGIGWSEIEFLALNGVDERVDPRGKS